MKLNRRNLFLASSAVITVTFSTPSVKAQSTRYWDNNGNATAGFGTAGGTWGDLGSGSTTGNATQGWSTSISGNATTQTANYTTATNDSLNFGNSTASSLLGGTITVSGTVSAGNMTFASGSGSITLSGGTINLGANQTFNTANATSVNTISGNLTGGGNITKTGTGTLVLSGNNSINTVVVAASGGTLRLASTGAVPSARVTLNAATSRLEFGTDSSITAPAVTSTLGVIVSDRATVGNGTTHYITDLNVGTGGAGTTFEKGSNVTGGQAVIEIGSVSNNNGSVSTPVLTPNTANVIITGNVTLGTTNAGTANFGLAGTGSTNSIAGVIQNGNRTTANLNKSGTSTWILSGNNTYVGATNIANGTLQLGNGGISGRLGNTTSITFSGTNPSTATLVINRSNAFTQATDLNGQVIAGNGSFIQAGAGTTTLSLVNTYNGNTTVSAGTLALSGSGSVNSSSGITVNGNSTTKLLQNSSAAISPTVTLTTGILTGNGTVNTVNVDPGTGGIISNNDGVAGAPLTIGSLTFNGAATVNTFNNSASAAIVTTSLSTNAAGNVTINPTGTWTNGVTYDLISFGSIGGAGVGKFVLGTIGGASPRQTPTFSNTLSTITLSFTGDTPKWTGAGDAKWNLASTDNWKLVTGGGNTTFLANDDVLFDDTANATTVTIDTANVAPVATTFNNTTKDYTLTGSFGIGNGTLTKSGSGNLTINTTNTYTGLTTVNGGTVVISSGASLGSGSALTVGAIGTVDFQNAGQTLGAVSNANSLSFSAGNGTVTLASLTGSGNTTFGSNGVVTGGISAGTVSSTGNLTADISGGAVTAGGLLTGTISGSGTVGAGSLSSTSISGGTNTITNNASITTINGGSTTVGGVATIGTLTSGTATLNGATSTITTLNGGTVNLGNTTLTVSGGTMAGDITGASGSIYKTSSSALTLSGNNTFGGNLTLDGSALTGSPTLLTVSSNTALGSTAGGTTLIGSSTASGDGARLQLSDGITVTGETLTISTGAAGFRTMVRTTGNATWAGNVIIDPNGGFGQISAASAGNNLVIGNATTTFDLNGPAVFRGAGNTTVNSVIQGTAQLTKTDAGALILTAANTFTGNTSVGSTGSVVLANTSALGNSTVVLSGTSGGVSFGSPTSYTLGGLSAASAGSGRNIALTNTANASIALSVGNNNANTTYAGVMSGGGSLTKIGNGTLTLGGVNTYTGTTTVSGGTLALNSTGTIATDGNTSTTSDILINGGTLELAASERIGDTGSINMSSGAFNFGAASGLTETIDGFTNSGGNFTTGANTLIGLGNTITWSGGTNTINAGGLVQDAHIVISGGTNTVEGGASGGVLELLASGTGLEMSNGATLTLNSDALVAGSLKLGGDVSTSGNTTVTIASGGVAVNAGFIDLNGGNRDFTVADGSAATDMAISAGITNGGLTKAGDGTLRLSGVNNYGGQTSINAGTLQVTNGSALSNSGAVVLANNATAKLQLLDHETIGSLAGGALSTVDLDNKHLTVGDTSVTTYSGTIIGGSSSELNVQTTGAGKLTIEGTNTYSGITNIAAGADLRIDGNNTGAGDVNVAGNLGGLGSVAGTVTIASGGTLAPGNGIESFGVGAVEFLAGSTYAYELNSAALNGDLTYSSGTLDIAPTTTLTLTELASGTLALGSKLTLISYNGGWTGTELFTYLGSPLADDSTFTLGSNQWFFNYDDNIAGSNYTADLTGPGFVTMTVIPEPRAALLGGLGLLALLRRRRN